MEVFFRLGEKSNKNAARSEINRLHSSVTTPIV